MYFFSIFLTSVTFQISVQYCPEEVSSSGMQVTWRQSLEASFLRSDPLCVHNKRVITRNCTNDNKWIPPLNEVPSCSTAVRSFDPLSCPPGFKNISTNKTKYCYQIEEPSPWSFPCLQCGGATIVTELDENETESLIFSLKSTNHSYFWLPALRHKMLSPIVWSIPGPNWGRLVTTNNILTFRPSLLRNCLLLDVQQKKLVTDNCNKEYPSLCFHTNIFHYATKCPENYHTFRFTSQARCFGIEKTQTMLTFREFLENKCNKPMGNGLNRDLRKYIFSKVAIMSDLANDTWCWFSSPRLHNKLNNDQTKFDENGNSSNTTTTTQYRNFPRLVKVINSIGLMGLMDSSSTLSCMACETNMTYSETELTLEYNAQKKQLFLTIYYPSGLWMYNNNDRGVQCFTDADGFFQVIEINDSSNPLVNAEQVSYVINLVTNRSASYWCEGHTTKFSLLSTKKIVVNPQGHRVHVFSLVLELNVHLNETDHIGLNRFELVETITFIFEAKKVLLMDILGYNFGMMKILIHLHVSVNNTFSEESRNLQATYEFMKSRAEMELPKFNYTFVNISSSVYCLPSSSVNSIMLDWDLTPIGYIAAPRQFCLQANGLPVNRQCHGSYLLGSVWGNVEGLCDTNYQPTNTTTFLFNFVKNHSETDYLSRFLTVGAEFIFKDLNILIPADIYYLSISFQVILNTANQNIASIETGDIENIAWIMDRMMNIDNNNLRLAQTLNSTNSILESTNNIIGLISNNNINVSNNKSIKYFYQLAVQPRFLIQISYPKFSNVTGIAVIRNGNSDSFTDMLIKPLYKNTTAEDVLSIKNLEVATWLPHHVLNNLKKSTIENNHSSVLTDSLHIIINVYNNNYIFQELSENQHVLISRIIEVNIPGYDTYLEQPIPLVFRELKQFQSSKECGYWNFHSGKGKIPGTWSKLGCILKANSGKLTLCECFHLTHFAQLVNINWGQNSNESMISEGHNRTLNIITLIGSFLSLLGIVGIWITATVFDTWRKKTGTKVLLHLSLSIALPLVLLITFNLDGTIIVEIQGEHMVPSNMVIICVALGAIFHYSVLSNFTWMLITAILQFIRYVRVLGVSRPSRFMIKVTLIGWGIPFIPVIITLHIDSNNYIPSPSSNRSFCYPSGLYMILGVITPICMVLFINVILFLLVIRSISKTKDVQATYRNLIYAQFRLSIFLFFLLGLTWLFGVASFSGNLIWSYLFCLTSTIQGFVLFIYFIICDPNTRNMWIGIMKPQFTRPRTSVTTISGGC